MRASLLIFRRLGLMILCAMTLATGAPESHGASPDFTLAAADTVSLKLSDLQGRPVLLLFADTSEESSKALSAAASIYDYYSVSELALASVAVGKTPAEANQMQENLWLTYTLYADSNAAVAQSFGLRRFPALVILDNKHTIRYEGNYLTDTLALRRMLREGMQQKVFFVTAKKFRYTPGFLEVSQGDRVLIKLISEDVEHGMYVDGYDMYLRQYLDRNGAVVPPEKAEKAVKPGELGVLSFTADKAGRFTIRCASTCGDFHPYMLGHLIVKNNVLFPAALSMILLLALLYLILAFRPTPDREKLFGIVPLAWKFELTKFPLVRALLKSRWFPLLPIIFNLSIFTIILMAAYIGGFNGAGNYNFGVMIVWILWWVLLMMFMVPFIGRFWCMICPFPLFGDWLQRGKLFLVGRQKSFGLGKRWPNKWRNLWPLVLLFFVSTWFSAFFTVRPLATFILLGTIIGVAVIISLIFEKRTFCLFVCPVSGFQGLYSNFSACEVRVKDPEICKKHTPKTCVVGSDKGYGCPWMELPFDMNRNTYCGMCMECFKTCPHDNMAVNVRPFGKDLLAPRRKTDDSYHRRGTDEAFKALSMVGIFLAFFLAFQSPYARLKDMARGTTGMGFLSYISELTFTDFLLVPGAFLLFAWLSKLSSRDKAVKLKSVFVNFSYCLIPLGLAIWAAFSVGIILPNGSYIVHVVSDPFGWGWDLFGTANFVWTPFLTIATPYLQVGLTLVGLLFALEYGFKLARLTFSNISQARRGWIPMVLGLSFFCAAFIWLFAG
jgi:polyferredoxin/peroxiredoxin